MMLETENHIYLLKQRWPIKCILLESRFRCNLWWGLVKHLNEDSMTLIFKLKERNPEVW